MPDENPVSSGLEKVFEHRQSFILIGLTGRTGSGCSTIAEILSQQQFSEADPE
jgi:putative protein kinase ArgK-like GTPase of G3E family